jgi:hypothetical protein
MGIEKALPRPKRAEEATANDENDEVAESHDEDEDDTDYQK